MRSRNRVADYVPDCHVRGQGVMARPAPTGYKYLAIFLHSMLLCTTSVHRQAFRSSASSRLTKSLQVIFVQSCYLVRYPRSFTITNYSPLPSNFYLNDRLYWLANPDNNLQKPFSRRSRPCATMRYPYSSAAANFGSSCAAPTSRPHHTSSRTYRKTWRNLVGNASHDRA